MQCEFTWEPRLIHIVLNCLLKYVYSYFFCSPILFQCHRFLSECTGRCRQTLEIGFMHLWMQPSLCITVMSSPFLLDKTKPVMCLQGISGAAFIRRSLFSTRHQTKTDGVFLCLFFLQFTLWFTLFRGYFLSLCECCISTESACIDDGGSSKFAEPSCSSFIEQDTVHELAVSSNSQKQKSSSKCKNFSFCTMVAFLTIYFSVQT